MSAGKKPRESSHYNRQLIKVLDQYIDQTGKTTVDLSEVVDWALSNKLIDYPKADMRKILARNLSRASREEIIQDENGEPVRRRHSYKIVSGETQLTFWVRMEDASPHQMRLSMQQRRKGIANDVFQADRDVNYYNRNHNPGDPITPDWNFNADVEERKQSGEYDDNPPPESGD
ncbi:MAG: hypothetical protein U0790_00240 [Isosphaeraceae bacterium]